MKPIHTLLLSRSCRAPRESPRHLLPVALLLATLALPVAADTQRWVTDQLSTTLRAGPGPEHQELGAVRSGTLVSVLENDSTTGFSRVNVNGKVGWLPTGYLDSQPGGREQLAQARATIERLMDKGEPLQGKLLDLEAVNTQLRHELTAVNNRAAMLEADLSHLRSMSSDTVKRDENNQKLLARSQQLQNEIDILRAETQRLSDKSDREWFINGVFAVAFGVLLALVIPRLKPRKRHSEWT